MKKTLLSLLLAISFVSGFGQWAPPPFSGDIYNTNPGNVGIGLTNTINEKLTIDGNIQLWHFNDPYPNRRVKLLDRLSLQATVHPGNDWNRGVVASNFVWNNSNQMWHVDGGAYSDFSAIRFESNGRIGFYNRPSTGSSYDMTEQNLYSYCRLFINENGQVGINTRNPGSYQLAVEGKIVSREIKVTAGPFPDYVFDKRYQLRDLKTLEKYIKQYKHLPGIPSAKEVEKNEGIELGDMNKRLLEKVEELTLYIIDLNKKIEELQNSKSTIHKN